MSIPKPKDNQWLPPYRSVLQIPDGSFVTEIEHTHPNPTSIRYPVTAHLQVSVMASSAPPSSAAGARNPKKSLGFLANAAKRKDSFIQFFAMTGILLLSLRSLGQKYRINDLREDTSALREEQGGLADRMNHIKTSLRAEAAADPTGLFASRLRLLFGEDH
ncbi:cytosolic thiouridylase subunit Ctu1 [Sarracenia purpurea var. burkii]